MVEEQVMEETEPYLKGGVLMIGVRTGRKCNRSRIMTGVRFMPSGGIYT